MAEHDSTLATLAALIEGDGWLNAVFCAVLFGLTTHNGKANRHCFLERVACRLSFPAPLQVGNEKKWKRSELLRWADDERSSGR